MRRSAGRRGWFGLQGGWRLASGACLLVACGFLSCSCPSLKHIWEAYTAPSLSYQPEPETNDIRKEAMLHVCLLLTSRDLQGVYVAIRSAVTSSTDPKRLHFHLLSPQWLVPVAAPLVASHFRTFGASVSLHCNVDVEAVAMSLASASASASEESDSSSPFLFATFLLPAFLRSGGTCGRWQGTTGSVVSVKRLVYISSDVVVRGDLLEFLDLDLGGRPAALGVDCRLAAKALVKASTLRKLGLNASACVPELGLVVMDADTWESSQVLDQVKGHLLRDAAKLRVGRLLVGWLLVSMLGIQPLASQWSCSNLGRSWMTMQEGWHLRHGGFDHRSFQDLGISVDPIHGTATPYLATCTDKAYLLRFNGPLKPWLAGSWKDGSAPVCKIPLWLKRWVAAGYTSQPERVRSAQVYRRETFVPCYELWRVFIPLDVACSLSDTSGQWVAEESLWFAAAEAGRKKKAEEARAQEEREQMERAKINKTAEES